MQNINLVFIVMAGGLLAACTNPALHLEQQASASSSTALAACQVAQGSTEVLPTLSRGLYERALASADAASSPTGYAGAATGCADLQGSYAIKVELDVYAQDDPSAVSPQYDPTRERAQVLLRADVDAGAGVELRLCGLELPTRYAYASSSATQLLVPDDAWDRSDMPVWNSHLRTAQETQLQLDAFPVLLGIALTDPGETWPSYEETPELACGAARSGSDCFPDHDGDGEPGLTLRMRADREVVDGPYPACHTWSYQAPSTQPQPWIAADNDGAGRLFVGLRTALQLSLQLDESCTQGTGSVVAEDILTRVFDCELTDGQRCTPAEATVADARAPSFHVLAKHETPAAGFHDSRAFIDAALDRAPSDGGSVSVRRLASSEQLSCTAVRAAFGG